MGSLEVAMKVTVRWCADNFRYFVLFRKSIVFILGLVFSYKLVETLFLNILITRLTPSTTDGKLRKAIVVVNLQGGTASVLAIFMAFVADAYTGLFNMVAASSIICISGLLVTHFAATSQVDDSVDFLGIYPALVLMTLSQAITMISFNSFLSDQLVEPRDQPPTTEEELRRERRTKFWWYSVSILAAIVATFGPLKEESLWNLARVLAMAMGAASIWFLLGSKLYNRVKPSGSDLRYVPIVICSAIVKSNVGYPHSPEQLHQNSSGEVQVLPHVSWLRWLDKAAVTQETWPRCKRCSVEQVKLVKALLKMLPMWSTFITFSLVSAAGSTFFLEEAASITNRSLPILLFTNLQKITEVVVSETLNYVLEKLREKKKYDPQNMAMVRIGVGMLCCVLCCIAAWTQAVHRSDLVKTCGTDIVKDDHMIVYKLLTPQFLLLALTGGFCSEGLEDFFKSQVTRSMSGYGTPFGECVMGIGTFMGIVCTLVFSKGFLWLRDEVNLSRLDKYYAFLAALSFANILLYCLAARWYRNDSFLVPLDREDDTSELQEEIGQQQTESSPTHHVPLQIS